MKRSNRHFANVRQIGTVAALDIVASDAGQMANIGPCLYQSFLAQGLLVRPLGNTIYIMPPYCSTAGELDLVYEAISEITNEIE